MDGESESMRERETEREWEGGREGGSEGTSTQCHLKAAATVITLMHLQRPTDPQS